MKTVLSLLIVAVGLVVVFCLTENVNADEYQQGQAIYASKCAMCHGGNGKGDGPAAASFNPRPLDLTNPSFWEHQPRQRITNAIENGYGVMPQIDLSSAQTQLVVNYIEHAFKSPQ